MSNIVENNICNVIYKMLNDAKIISTTYPDKSYIMSKEAYHMAKTNNLKQEEGEALIGMSLACRAKSEINSMLDYSFNALEIFDALKCSFGQIKSLNLIGIAFFYNSMYEDSLNYLLKAKDLLAELIDNNLLSSILNNIGEVFREIGNYEKALEYYNSALKICIDMNLKINIASILSNIGEIYFIENKYGEALKYFTKSYNILIKERDMVIIGEVENKLGKVYYINNNYSKAEEYFFSALKRLDNVENKFYAIDVLVNIGKMQIEKNSDKAIYYFEKATKYAEETSAKKKLSEVYKTISEYYEKIGDFKEALECFKKYHNVHKEIATSTIGNKFKAFKIELSYLKEEDKFEKIKMINKRLEMMVANQNNKLDRMQKLNEILEKNTLEDALTGVPNRRYINYHLNQCSKESFLHDSSMVIFIIDIDNFKKYNDYWGHLKGDECLIKIANSIKDIYINRKDIFGRYGGEEFLYYSKGVNYDQALELGNQIRNEVEKLCIKYTRDKNSSVVTVSVGGAFGKLSNYNDIYNMIKVADKELYKAKGMGRNIVSVKSLIK